MTPRKTSQVCIATFAFASAIAFAQQPNATVPGGTPAAGAQAAPAATASPTGTPVVATSPAKPEPQPIQAGVVAQRWHNAAEFACRAPNESAEQYQLRVNSRVLQVGQSGWELAAISSIGLAGAVRGADCLVLGFRKPLGR